ncbi:hypothetical protein TNCV_1842241 [Trichonephila clavipes]|nr:hypothetical protein TNCV_1842241 [Trichonephila clavipes]
MPQSDEQLADLHSSTKEKSITSLRIRRAASIKAGKSLSTRQLRPVESESSDQRESQGPQIYHHAGSLLPLPDADHKFRFILWQTVMNKLNNDVIIMRALDEKLGALQGPFRSTQ